MLLFCYDPVFLVLANDTVLSSEAATEVSAEESSSVPNMIT